MTRADPTAVFVYGTLKRGQCREAMWPERPIRILEACVRGKLYNRSDYPAMTPGQDCVMGEVWEFDDALMPVVLHTLDQIEGTNQPGFDNLYQRVIVEIMSLDDHPLGRAYTYHYATDPESEGFERISPRIAGDYVAWPIGA